MKGILMQEPLFNKAVEGNKTETRRILKIRNFDSDYTIFEAAFEDGTATVSYIYDVNGSKEWGTSTIKPRYNKDEIVYLKEPYFVDSKGDIYYKYLFIKGANAYKFKNKLFMPEKAARFFIKITDVRLELLKDITVQGVEKEGIHLQYNDSIGDLWKEWKDLWNSISGKTHPYDSNPFVWVYEFEMYIKE